MAARISAVGRVTVSLRKSTAPPAAPARFNSITTSVLVSVATLRLFSLPSLVNLCLPLRTSAPSAPPHYLFPGRSLLHQLHKNLIRNANSPRSQAHQTPLPFNQPRRTKPGESRIQSNSVLPLNPPQIDPRQLPQPQKQLFLQRTLCRKPLKLFHRQSSRGHRRNIPRRIVRVSPSLRPGKRVRPGPKPQISLPPPILQVMPRSKSRLGPIRYLVMLIARSPQLPASRLIKLRHLVIARHFGGTVPFSPAQNLASQPAPLIHLQ